jgi:hypothetical protein
LMGKAGFVTNGQLTMYNVQFNTKTSASLRLCGSFHYFKIWWTGMRKLKANRKPS